MKTCQKCGGLFEGRRCKECARNYQNNYRAKYPEKTAEAVADWRIKNQDRVLTLARAYYAKNKEAIVARVSAWRSKNPGLHRINNQNRRALVKKAGGKISKDVVNKLHSLQRGKCACCGLPLGSKYHIDHVLPLSLGGSNSDSNIQLLRASCNLRKHAKHPIDYMQSKGMLL